MAKYVLRDAYVLVNGVNLSDHVSKVELDPKWTTEDGTTMGAQGTSPLAALRDEAVKVTFKNDHAAASVDQTMWPIYIGGTTVAIEIRPTSAARSTTNPAWTGNALLTDYSGLGGEVGKVSEVDATFDVDGVLTRQTS